MKRPMGYRTIRCPHCQGKVRILFRTLHRLKVEVDKSMRGGTFRGGSVPLLDDEEGQFPPDEEMSGAVQAAYPQKKAKDD